MNNHNVRKRSHRNTSWEHYFFLKLKISSIQELLSYPQPKQSFAFRSLLVCLVTPQIIWTTSSCQKHPHNSFINLDIICWFIKIQFDKLCLLLVLSELFQLTLHNGLYVCTGLLFKVSEKQATWIGQSQIRCSEHLHLTLLALFVVFFFFLLNYVSFIQ